MIKWDQPVKDNWSNWLEITFRGRNYPQGEVLLWKSKGVTNSPLNFH